MQLLEDGNRVTLVARNLLHHPLIFNPDLATHKRIKFEKRLGVLKEVVRGFVPERGEKMGWPKGLKYDDWSQRDNLKHNNE